MKVDNLFQKTGAKETVRSSHNTQLENSKNNITQRKLIWFLFYEFFSFFVAGQKRIVEKTLARFFPSAPSQWWDHRWEKVENQNNLVDTGL
jgi:hypothetical protein